MSIESMGPRVDVGETNPENNEKSIGEGPFFLAGKAKSESYSGDNTVITLAVWHGTPVLAPSSQLDRGLELSVAISNDEKDVFRTGNEGYDISGIYRLESGELLTEKAYTNKYGKLDTAEKVAA